MHVCKVVIMRQGKKTEKKKFKKPPAQIKEIN